jgi:predicted nucleotidyltransferase
MHLQDSLVEERKVTTEEYLIARKSKSWKFNRVVPDDSFENVNRIHPIKQREVRKIVSAARNDDFVKRIIIFGSSIRYDCDMTSDLDICIDWVGDCYDEEGVLRPYTDNMRRAISNATKGNADVVNYGYLEDTVVGKAVEEGVVVYEHNV